MSCYFTRQTLCTVSMDSTQLCKVQTTGCHLCLASQQTAPELNAHGDMENILYFNWLGSKVAGTLAG